MKKGINELRAILKKVFFYTECFDLKTLNKQNELLDDLEEEVRRWALSKVNRSGLKTIKNIRNKWTVREDNQLNKNTRRSPLRRFSDNIMCNLWRLWSFSDYLCWSSSIIK